MTVTRFRSGAEQTVGARPSAPLDFLGLDNFEALAGGEVVGEDHQIVAGPSRRRRDQAVDAEGGRGSADFLGAAVVADAIKAPLSSGKNLNITFNIR
jgi:hypothetical protein